MMVFMGFLFFKVPSGLCLYFIVSTMWGLVERRFIPKAKKPDETLAIDDAPGHGQKPTETKKPTVKKGGTPTPQKSEGRFAKWWREVMEKASEQQKLGQQNKNKDKKKKKR